MTLFEELPALSPVQFFSLSWDCPYYKGTGFKANDDTRLPAVEDLCAEEAFADLFMAWNEEKLALEVRVRSRTEGDSVELFFDTRDLKTKSHLSKFCHHFLFMPDSLEGVYGREITRFYNDEMHRLADPDELQVLVEGKESSYTLKIEIPATCLFGYDPLQFPRIGFTYRINRAGAPAQHFAISSEEFSIEQQPALWATLQFKGGPK